MMMGMLCLKYPSRSQDSLVLTCLENHAIYIIRSMGPRWPRSSMTIHCTSGSPHISRFQSLIQVLRTSSDPLRNVVTMASDGA